MEGCGYLGSLFVKGSTDCALCVVLLTFGVYRTYWEDNRIVINR